MLVNYRKKRLLKETSISFADRHPCFSDRVFFLINGLLIAFFTAIVLIPMINIVASSFSSPEAVNSGKVFLWPVDFTLEGYRMTLEYPLLMRGYLNTLLYTSIGTVIEVLLVTITGFCLTKKELPGRAIVITMLTIMMMYGGGMIPTYLTYSSYGLLNNPLIMMLPGLIAPSSVFVARTFINGIPKDLEEAAYLDGCSDFRYFFTCVLPLSTAFLAVQSLNTIVSYWNSYFAAFMYLRDRELMPLQVFLREVLISAQLSAETTANEAMAEAATGKSDLLKYSMMMFTTLPMMLIYPFFQKYFAQGMMIGAVKG